MLEALKAQGVEVPEGGGEKKQRMGTRIRPKKNLQSQTSEEAVNESGQQKLEAGEPGGETDKVPEEVEVVKDAWDMESEDEKGEEEQSEVDTEKPQEIEDAEKSSEGEDDDSEEEDSQEGEDEDTDEGTEEGSVEPAEAEKKREKESAEIRIRVFFK
jgi:translation initiation factor 5B